MPVTVSGQFLINKANAKPAIADIKQQLGNTRFNIDVGLDKSAGGRIKTLGAQLNQLSNTLKQIRVDATSAASAISVLNRSLTGFANATSNISNIGKQFTTSLKSSNQNVNKLSNSIDDFSKRTELAGTRFLAFSVAAGVLIKTTQAFRAGVGEAVDFQRELVRIAQVTDKPISQLNKLQQTITELSTSFGVSSRDLAQVAVTFAQAGIKVNELGSALEAVAKASLAPTFKDINQIAEGSVAILSQFKLKTNQLEQALDALNSVSAAYAVESSDLIVAVQKTGGVFASMGGNLNELISLFTSVRSTTRESADTIATGFRTIFSRLQRPQVLEDLKDLNIILRFTREEAESLGKLDLTDQFVGPLEAIRRISIGLEGLQGTDPRFAAIIEQLGGLRQISKVTPLIREFATTQEAMNIALSSSGSTARNAAQAQQALLVQVTKVKEEFFALFRTVLESDAFKKMASFSLDLASKLITLADAVRPLIPLMTALAAVQLGRLIINIPAISNKLPIKRARGGFVPGSGNGDTVPAMLEPGEFVLRKSAVKALGNDTVQGLNVQKFARGNIVKTIKNRPYGGGLVNFTPPLGLLTSQTEGVQGRSTFRISDLNLPLAKTQALFDKGYEWAAANIVVDKPRGRGDINNKLRNNVGQSLIDISNNLFKPPPTSVTKDQSDNIVNKAIGSQGLGRIFEGAIQTFLGNNISSSNSPFDIVGNKGIKKLAPGLAGVNNIDVKLVDSLKSRQSLFKKAFNANLPFTTKLAAQKQKDEALALGFATNKRAAGIFNKDTKASLPKFATGGSILPQRLLNPNIKRSNVVPTSIPSDSILRTILTDERIRNTARDNFSRLPKEVVNQIEGFVPKGSSYLNSGNEGVVFKTPTGTVIRLGRPEANLGAFRPNIPEVLQPIRSAKFGPITAEELPFVPSLDDPENARMSELRRMMIEESMKKRLIKKGLLPTDVFSFNIGRDPNDKKIKMIDPATFKTPETESELRRFDRLKKQFGLAAGGTVDNVPALLTPGEFVINRKAAQQLGESRLNELNKGKIPKFALGGPISKFADGGDTFKIANDRIDTDPALVSLLKFARQLSSIVPPLELLGRGLDKLHLSLITLSQLPPNTFNLGPNPNLNAAPVDLKRPTVGNLNFGAIPFATQASETRRLADQLQETNRNQNTLRPSRFALEGETILGPSGRTSFGATAGKNAGRFIEAGNLAQVTGVREANQRGIPTDATGLRQNIIDQNLNKIREDLVKKEAAHLQKINTNISSADALSVAEEKVTRSLANKEKILINSNKEIVGLSSTIKQLNEKGLTPALQNTRSRSGIGGGFLQNIRNNPNARLGAAVGLSVAAPFISQSIDQNTGEANAGSGFGFRASRGISSGLGGAAVGAGLAVSLGATGVGIPLAAAVIGLKAFSDGLEQANQEIRAAKIGQSLQDIGKIFEQINSNVGSPSTENLSQISNKIAEITDLATQEAISKSTSFFRGGLNSKEFVINQRQGLNEKLGGLAPQLNQVISRSTLEAAKSLSALTNENLTEIQIRQSLGGQLRNNNEAFKQLETNLANISGRSLKDVQKSTDDLAVSQVRQIQLQQKRDVANREVGLGVQSIDLFTRALVIAAASTQEFSNKLDTIEEIFTGNFGASKPRSLSGEIEQFGLGNGKFAKGVTDIFAPFGDLGKDIQDTVLNFDKINKELPNVLSDVAGSLGTSGHTPSASVAAGLRNRLGPLSQGEQAAVSVISSAVPEDVGDFRKEALKGVVSFAQALTQAGAGPIQESLKHLASTIDQESRSTADALARNRQLLIQIGDSHQNLVNLEENRAKTIAELEAKRKGVDVTEVFGVEQSRAFIQQRQEKLVGVGQDLSPEGLGKAFQDINEELLSKTKQFNTKPTSELNKELEQLKLKSQNFGQALKNLTDETKNGAGIIRDRLGALEREKNSRLGLVKAFTFGDITQQQDIIRGAQLTQQFKGLGTDEQRTQFTRGLQQTNPDDFRRLVEFAEQNAGLQGNQGLSDKILSAFLGEKGGLPPAKQKEKETLEDALINVQKLAIAAEEKNIAARTVLQQAFEKSINDGIVKSNNELAQEIIKLKDAIQQQAQAKTNVETGIRKQLEPLFPKVSNLTDLKKIQANTPDLKKFLDAQDIDKKLQQTRQSIANEPFTGIKIKESAFANKRALDPDTLASELSTRLQRFGIDTNKTKISDLLKEEDLKIGSQAFGRGPENAFREIFDNISKKLIAENQQIKSPKVLENINLEGITSKSLDALAQADLSLITAFKGIAGLGEAADNAAQNINNLAKASSGITSFSGVNRASGGTIPGPKGVGTDTVPAMLTPGEFVINRRATQANLSLLHDINDGKIVGMKHGGRILGRRQSQTSNILPQFSSFHKDRSVIDIDNEKRRRQKEQDALYNDSHSYSLFDSIGSRGYAEGGVVAPKLPERGKKQTETQYQEVLKNFYKSETWKKYQRDLAQEQKRQPTPIVPPLNIIDNKPKSPITSTVSAVGQALGGFPGIIGADTSLLRSFYGFAEGGEVPIKPEDVGRKTFETLTQEQQNNSILDTIVNSVAGLSKFVGRPEYNHNIPQDFGGRIASKVLRNFIYSRVFSGRKNPIWLEPFDNVDVETDKDFNDAEKYAKSELGLPNFGNLTNKLKIIQENRLLDIPEPIFKNKALAKLPEVPDPNLVDQPKPNEPPKFVDDINLPREQARLIQQQQLLGANKGFGGQQADFQRGLIAQQLGLKQEQVNRLAKSRNPGLNANPNNPNINPILDPNTPNPFLPNLPPGNIQPGVLAKRNDLRDAQVRQNAQLTENQRRVRERNAVLAKEKADKIAAQGRIGKFPQQRGSTTLAQDLLLGNIDPETGEAKVLVDSLATFPTSPGYNIKVNEEIMKVRKVETSGQIIGVGDKFTHTIDVTRNPNLVNQNHLTGSPVVQIGSPDQLIIDPSKAGKKDISTGKTTTESFMNALRGGLPPRYLILGRRQAPLNSNLLPNGQPARVGAFAKGGSVDSVPAMLTPGEFVVNKNAVSAFGQGNLEKINRFQFGGPVGDKSAENTNGMNFDSINQALSQFSQNSTVLSQTLVQFNAQSTQLVEAMNNFPRQISLEGKHTVEVIINGADILTKIEPGIQELIIGETTKQIQNLAKNKMVGAGPLI